MKTRKEKTLRELAVRLCEGGSVEFFGLVVWAKEVTEDINPCEICHMDCICDMHMADLCGECDAYTRKKYLLYLKDAAYDPAQAVAPANHGHVKNPK